MKPSRKIGIKAFYLLFILIIAFVVTELMKTFVPFGMSLEGWKLALGTSTALLGIVWGGIATGNIRQKIESKINNTTVSNEPTKTIDDVPAGGN